MRYILPFVIALALLTSCEEKIQGNGVVKEETREAAPFEKVEIDGDFEVMLIPGNYSSLTIEADENLLQYIESYVKNGTLHVSSEKDFGRVKALNLSITLNNFRGLKSSGASEIRSQGMLKGGKMELDFSGAVEADLALVAQEIEGDFSGACEINLRGNARKLDFETSGAVEINAEALKSERCRLDMSGAGSAVVYVTEDLDIDISGAAEVRYKGKPANVKQDVSGAASIKPL